MRTTFYLLTILLITACQSTTQTDKTPQSDDLVKQNDTQTESELNSEKIDLPEANNEFTLYLDNFSMTELPLIIKGCWIGTKGLSKFDGKKFEQFSVDYSYSYKQIPTNGNYIATITLGAADCYLPILTTFKSNGQIIDRKTIAIGYCGSDCGYSCEEFMTITNDFKLYTSDTISTYVCDSLGIETPGTYEYYVIYKEGKLLTDGRIQLTDEIKKPLEGRKNEQ